MKQIPLGLGLLAVLVITQRSLSENYAWLTNWETSSQFPGSVIAFTGLDTLFGPVHSNDWISTRNQNGGLPVFYDRVSTTKPSFRVGSPNPAGEFLGEPPQFSAPPVRLPRSLEIVRTNSMQAGTYFDVPGHQWYASIHDSTLHCYPYLEGTALDTLNAQDITRPLNELAYVYFEGRVGIRGVIPRNGPRFVIASSESIRLVDNFMIEGTDTLNGELPENPITTVCLAAEGDVIIGNTPQNGRENSSLGSNVVITALIVAVRGSFRAEQMNFSHDPYLCDCAPDRRGKIILNGGITQWRRGFLFHSNRGGTGYSKYFRFDERIRHWNPGLYDDFYFDGVPDSMYFPDTPAGATEIDTLTITQGQAFSGAIATYPYYCNAPYQYSPPFVVPVSFTPPSAGPWSGLLSFFIAGEYHSVVLYGIGISNTPPIEPEVYPNPFNSTTNFAFALNTAGHVRAVVYDILGREVSILADEPFMPGAHTLLIDASRWASGVYFLKFVTPDNISTHKLLLLK